MQVAFCERTLLVVVFVLLVCDAPQRSVHGPNFTKIELTLNEKGREEREREKKKITRMRKREALSREPNIIGPLLLLLPYL